MAPAIAKGEWGRSLACESRTPGEDQKVVSKKGRLLAPCEYEASKGPALAVEI